MRVVRHPEVPQELEAAACWHQDRLAGLGDDFVAEYRATLTRIIQEPTRWRKIRGENRKLNFRRFPYAIVHSVGSNMSLIRLNPADQEPSRLTRPGCRSTRQGLGGQTSPTALHYKPIFNHSTQRALLLQHAVKAIRIVARSRVDEVQHVGLGRIGEQQHPVMEIGGCLEAVVTVGAAK